MENYESLGTIGEGTYGVVLKCRHKITGQIVAIKKFKESDEDEQVKKTALREIKILKQLQHENIVSLLEVFRMKGKLYLVFEFVEKTMLEEIEKYPEGLNTHSIKRLMWQLLRAIHFCHSHNIIHRDIKPENLLVSRHGVLKLCDFGFARPLARAGAKYTEYVSTRWYRAPELLVGDVSYGKAVDIWSIGCMFAEITTGLPLFPGDSDIDQLYHIIKCLGTITSRQQELFKKNPLYQGIQLPPSTNERESLEQRFPHFETQALDLLQQMIKEEPLDRWTCEELLKHPYFENESELYEKELKEAIQRDVQDTMTLRKKRMRNSNQNQSKILSSRVNGESGDAAVIATFKQTGGVESMLPTLSPACITPSSSFSSTASTVSVPQQMSPAAAAWNHLPVKKEPLETNQPRISMTSHGSRPTIPPQPTPFHSFAPPPKPPVGTTTTQFKYSHGNGTPMKPPRVIPMVVPSTSGFGQGSLIMSPHNFQQTMDIYSPKKIVHNSRFHATPLYPPSGSLPSPHGIPNIPPKTSQGRGRHRRGHANDRTF